jgi:hypothetical protein
MCRCKRIAALAETHGALLAPHCPLGPISLAASLQVALATPNFLIQVQSLGIHYHAGSALPHYLAEPAPLRIVDSHIPRPTGPGAGHHHRRGGGTAGRRDRARLAEPGLATRRRLVRRVVTGADGHDFLASADTGHLPGLRDRRHAYPMVLCVRL